MNGYGVVVERYWQGKTDVLGGKKKPVPLLLCPWQIQSWLTWNRTQVSRVRRKKWAKEGLGISSSFIIFVLNLVNIGEMVRELKSGMHIHTGLYIESMMILEVCVLHFVALRRLIEMEPLQSASDW